MAVLSLVASTEDHRALLHHPLCCASPHSRHRRSGIPAGPGGRLALFHMMLPVLPNRNQHNADSNPTTGHRDSSQTILRPQLEQVQLPSSILLFCHFTIYFPNQK